MLRRLSMLVLLVSLLGFGTAIHRAIDRFIHPDPAWMVAKQWYNEALVAAWFAALAVACVLYNVRRFGNQPQSTTNKTKLWRDQSELRIILYAWAIVHLAQLPLDIFKAIAASHDASVPWRPSFWSAFPFDSLLLAAIGLTVIVSDRRRLLQDRKQLGLCSTCSYDLRASQHRCPECGEPIPPSGVQSPQ